ncbi:MAG: NtrZ family periplasmic regulatory protein [Pseudomonadota bacterium]
MRLIAAAILLSSACLPAFADDSTKLVDADQRANAEIGVSVPDMGAPSISESDRAEPDWYQQFTFSSNDVSSSPDWQDVTSQSLKLNWIKGERWSVSVDLTSRDYAGNTALPTEEMSAGAEFRITPRISVGGEVSFGTAEAEKSDMLPEDQTEAGIRLRSAFKF